MKYTGMIRKAVSGLLNKKRFLALALILALAFSCIGCGDYDEEEIGQRRKHGRRKQKAAALRQLLHR